MNNLGVEDDSEFDLRDIKDEFTKVTQVEVKRTFNTGNYTSFTVGLTAIVRDEESYEDVFHALNDECERLFLTRDRRKGA